MKFLRASREKNQIFFPCWAFLSHFVGECLLKYENLPALKNSWLRACIQIKYIMQQNPYLQTEKQLFENKIYHLLLLLLNVLKEEYDEMLQSTYFAQVHCGQQLLS